MIFTVYKRSGCCFCHNLIRALDYIKDEYSLEYEIEEADDDEAIPYIVFTTKDGRTKKLVGFHEKKSLLNFLELEAKGNETETESYSKTKNRKFLRKFI